jgi:hypothetical protein
MRKQVSFLLIEIQDVMQIFPVRALTCDRPGSAELKSWSQAEGARFVVCQIVLKCIKQCGYKEETVHTETSQNWHRD